MNKGSSKELYMKGNSAKGLGPLSKSTDSENKINLLRSSLFQNSARTSRGSKYIAVTITVYDSAPKFRRPLKTTFDMIILISVSIWLKASELISFRYLTHGARKARAMLRVLQVLVLQAALLAISMRVTSGLVMARQSEP